MQKEITLLLVGDTHSGNKEYPWGCVTSQNWVKILANAAEQQGADLLIHTGDFTDKGDLAGTRRIARALGELKRQGLQTIGIEGNHDPVKNDPTRNRTILKEEGGVIFVDEKAYKHEPTGFGFTGDTNHTGGMGLADFIYQFKSDKEFAAFENGLLLPDTFITEYEAYGKIGLDRVRQEISNFTRDNTRHFVLTHFPPIMGRYRLEDPQRPSPLETNSEFGDMIEQSGQGLTVTIFHGHYHHGNTPTKLTGGINLINGAVEFAYQRGRPYTVYSYPPQPL